jgi:hypothetical protein
VCVPVPHLSLSLSLPLSLSFSLSHFLSLSLSLSLAFLLSFLLTLTFFLSFFLLGFALSSDAEQNALIAIDEAAVETLKKTMQQKNKFLLFAMLKVCSKMKVSFEEFSVALHLSKLSFLFFL